mmetsp:Transcript_141929/g.353736  ORF Transcript_141929/g.353736 Transcript_141929/m.353736 type:complete len:226 (-) Transcript_141929:734-1411(-)
MLSSSALRMLVGRQLSPCDGRSTMPQCLSNGFLRKPWAGRRSLCRPRLPRPPQTLRRHLCGSARRRQAVWQAVWALRQGRRQAAWARRRRMLPIRLLRCQVQSRRASEVRCSGGRRRSLTQLSRHQRGQSKRSWTNCADCQRDCRRPLARSFRTGSMILPGCPRRSRTPCSRLRAMRWSRHSRVSWTRWSRHWIRSARRLPQVRLTRSASLRRAYSRPHRGQRVS